MAEEKGGKRGSLLVDLTLYVPKHKDAPDILVYLFDRSGRLVESMPATERTVEFKIDPTQRYRVTVGPNLLTGDAQPADLTERLIQASAISRDYSPLQRADKISFSVREHLILKWIFVCMNIHGTVRKLLNPGESPSHYAPICTGIVEIFMIDLACSLARLSNTELLAIKNAALARIIFPHPVPAVLAGMAPLTGIALRLYIVTHRSELARYMCNLIPEWAICYRQLPNATIQSDGTFSLDYCFFFWETPPDLYFEVKQTIHGVEREVADPDIMCTMMWRYDGSVGAVITVEDPEAVACLEPPPTIPGTLFVWPTAIGNISLREINGLTTLAGTGLLPGGPHGTPWGGTLCLQVLFDPQLQANDVQFYRWSYSFAGEAFAPITATVTHRYMDITFGPGGTIDINEVPVVLGPHPAPTGPEPSLFDIPDPTRPWININDPQDRPFAYFDSTVGRIPARSGMVTLKLEMFDHNGVHKACGNDGHGGPFQFVLPDPGAPPGHHTSATGPNIDANGDLIFKLLVDNNPTNAELLGVTVSGNSADPCGMLHYANLTDPVSISYVATHPNNYLWWDLGVTRGFEGTAESAHGEENSAVPDHLDNPASVLLGHCVQAAFAVNLNTHARAESGYGRQSQYDDSATVAFALLHP